MDVHDRPKALHPFQINSYLYNKFYIYSFKYCPVILIYYYFPPTFLFTLKCFKASVIDMLQTFINTKFQWIHNMQTAMLQDHYLLNAFY